MFRNPLVPCDAISIPRINLLPWKEGLQFISPPSLTVNSTVTNINEGVGAPFIDLSSVSNNNINSNRQPKQNSLDEDDHIGPSSDFNIKVNFR